MAKLYGINTKMRGSVGQYNFYQRAGETCVREKVAPKDNPKRTKKQMKRRVQWANIQNIWVLPWVHVAISNAKALLKDMYHGIKEEFLQSYLDEFCYKFNRMYFGDRTFDRLVVAAVAYKPTFKHRPYNSSPLCG